MYDRKSFQNIVTIFPPDKAENEETILFKFGLKDGAVLKLAVASQTAKHFATQLLLLTGSPSG